MRPSKTLFLYTEQLKKNQDLDKLNSLVEISTSYDGYLHGKPPPQLCCSEKIQLKFTISNRKIYQWVWGGLQVDVTGNIIHTQNKQEEIWQAKERL